ncbi:MAG: radical SAM protein [Candidatus Coatesbacteria bacterium]|nr:radical SAM protein [Candidatus Coatesbacteria bacterium]
MRYIFGPVPSRRLGMSLGVDMVPYKTCSFDCVYCECGHTTVHEKTRRRYFDSIADVLDEISSALKTGRQIDYITLGGSGEPTLNLELGETIREIKRLTDVKVAVLTNGSLITDKGVFQELLNADLVVPSLDSARQASFEKVNLPAKGILVAEIIEAQRDFVRAFDGDVWLEILIVEDLNDSEDDLIALTEAVNRINPLLVQVGTVERPGSEEWAKPVSFEVLKMLASRIGPNAMVIGGPKRTFSEDTGRDIASDILALVSRRPCTIEDIESAVGGKRPILLGEIRELSAKDKIATYMHKGKIFYVGGRGQKIRELE